MKKLFKSLLVVALLFTFTACKKETAQSVMEKAVEKMSTVEYLDLSGAGNINVGASGMTMDMPLTYEFSIENPTKLSDMKASGSYSMSLMGMSIDSEVYIADGNLYTDTLGTRAVSPLGVDTEDTQTTKADYSSLKMVKDGSSYVLSIGFTSFDELKEMIEKTDVDAIASLEEALAAFEEMDIKTYAMELSLKVSSDFKFETATFTMDFEGTVEQQEMSMKLNFDISFEYPAESNVVLPDLENWAPEAVLYVFDNSQTTVCEDPDLGNWYQVLIVDDGSVKVGEMSYVDAEEAVYYDEETLNTYSEIYASMNWKYAVIYYQDGSLSVGTYSDMANFTDYDNELYAELLNTVDISTMSVEDFVKYFSEQGYSCRLVDTE